MSSSSLSSITSSELTRCPTPLSKTRRLDPFGLGFLKLLLAHIGLSMCLFLATTDGTIVSTELPIITSHLSGPSSLYSWISTSYLLAQTVIQPFVGVFIRTFGYKPVLYASVSVFTIGSAGSGWASNLYYLVASRAIQGLGAGGIVTVVWSILSKLVYPQDRNRWQIFMSATWAFSAASGPFLGGVFTDKISWRWGFYINLPIGGAALAIIIPILYRIPLVEEPVEESPSAHSVHWFWKCDVPGLFFLASGALMLLFGFSIASTDGWDSTRSILLLSSATIVLVGVLGYEALYVPCGVIPSAFFRDRTIGIVMVATFFQTFCYTSVTYYLALYYQAVLGRSAIVAGEYLLSFSLVSALCSGLVAPCLAPRISLKWLVFAGFLITAVGFGLLQLFNIQSTTPLCIGLPLVIGVGFSFLLKLPNDLLMLVLKDKHLASLNGNFFLVRMMGCTTGLSISAAIFTSRLEKLIRTVPYEMDVSRVDWDSLALIEPAPLRDQVLSAVSRALGTVWLVCAAVLAASCMLCLFIHLPKPMSSPVDLESNPPSTVVQTQPLGSVVSISTSSVCEDSEKKAPSL